MASNLDAHNKETMMLIVARWRSHITNVYCCLGKNLKHSNDYEAIKVTV